MRSLWTGLALLALLGACAGGPVQRHERTALNEYLPYAGPPVERFNFFRLDSWQSVGPLEVIIWSDAFTAYLVRVREPCTGLQFTNRIGVTSTVGTISRLESLVLRDHERCLIDEIRPIDLKQMKADRAAERAADRAEQAAKPH